MNNVTITIRRYASAAPANWLINLQAFKLYIDDQFVRELRTGVNNQIVLSLPQGTHKITIGMGLIESRRSFMVNVTEGMLITFKPNLWAMITNIRVNGAKQKY
jgi:hypothetical protein